MKKLDFKFLLFSALIFVMSVYACSTDELKNPLDVELKKSLNRASPTGNYDHFILPDAKDYANIPQEKLNPLNEAKVELGKMLFYETGLALEPKYPQNKLTYSCASCHIPDAGFMPGRAQGIADGGAGFGINGEGREKMYYYHDNEPDVQGARALNVCNVAFVPNTTWAGMFGGNDNNVGTQVQWTGDLEINHLGLQGLESQAIAVLKVHRMLIDEAIVDSLGYKHYFDAAFPEFPKSTRYSKMTLGFAVSAYLRALIPSKAPFQNWLRGNENALSENEKKGALLFFGKAGCYKCHSGKALHNPTQFFAVGVKDLYETGEAIKTDVNDKRNFGRGGFTQRAEDMFKFKVPQLYNMHGGSHYFHGSSRRTLREVVEYFNAGVPENARVPKEQIAPQFHPLNLTKEEIDNLVLFLEHSLFDPDMHRFVPEKVLSGLCFPNNDAQSKADLGCD
jgi:cytochrome c peroxidase